MRVDVATAERFLRERYGTDVEDVAAVAQQGVWSSAFTFRRRGDELVLRLTPYRDDLERDRIAAGWASADLPIPPILDIGEGPGGGFAVSPRIPGVHLDGLDGGAMRRVLPSLFAALDALRRIDASAFTGFGGWGRDQRGEHASWRDWLLAVRRESVSRDLPPWRPRMAASSTGTAPFDRAFDALASLVDACPDERHVVHNDLLANNVLVDDGRVAAVLDWGSSILGDFLYDLAKLVFFLPWYPKWSAIDLAREGAAFYRSTGADLSAFDERLRCYMLHIGLEHQAWWAARGDWANLDRGARETLAIAEAR